MKIKQFRQEMNLTQKAVAQLVGTTDKNVWAWENGIATPNTEMLIKLADLFGISIDSLIGRIDLEDTVYYKLKITPEEEEYIIKFRKLKNKQQLRVLGYIDALGESK